MGSGGGAMESASNRSESSIEHDAELPDAPTTDEDCGFDFDMEIVSTQSGCGGWGLGHRFGGKLYFTHGIQQDKWVPKNLLPLVSAMMSPVTGGSQFPMWSFSSSGIADTERGFPHTSTLEVCPLTHFQWSPR